MTIAVDFDGVLHRYSKGWQGGSIYDPPMDGAVEAVNKLVGLGHRIIVFTTRVALDEVRVWLLKHDFSIDINDVTNIKPIAHIYIDDRAVRHVSWEQTWQIIEPMLGKEHGWSSDKQLDTPPANQDLDLKYAEKMNQHRLKDTESAHWGMDKVLEELLEELGLEQMLAIYRSQAKWYS